MNDEICFEDLRSLKQWFVKQVLQFRREQDDEIETICAISPDSAITVLRRENHLVTRVLPLVARANTAMRELTEELSAVDQSREVYLLDAWPQEQEALDTLRRLAECANRPFDPEVEKQKNAALRVLVWETEEPAGGKEGITVGFEKRPF